MRSRGLSEDEAYALMRRTAMNQNRKIVEIAQSLITAASLLDPGTDA
jgi:response regulator NasT